LYILREDIKLWDTKDFFVCGELIDKSCPLFSWKDGKKKYDILHPYLPLTFSTDVNTDPKDYARASDTSFFLGNNKLRDIFRKQIENDEIELIPCKIINKKMRKEYDYWVFNVINQKKIIDEKHSVFSKHTSETMPVFLKIQINQKAISLNQDIYYDPNMLGEYIISDRLAEKILNAHLAGMEVIPIEQYTDKFYKE
jgi:hypothetical protein